MAPTELNACLGHCGWVHLAAETRTLPLTVQAPPSERSSAAAAVAPTLQDVLARAAGHVEQPLDAEQVCRIRRPLPQQRVQPAAQAGEVQWCARQVDGHRADARVVHAAVLAVVVVVRVAALRVVAGGPSAAVAAACRLLLLTLNLRLLLWAAACLARACRCSPLRCPCMLALPTAAAAGGGRLAPCCCLRAGRVQAGVEDAGEVYLAALAARDARLRIDPPNLCLHLCQLSLARQVGLHAREGRGHGQSWAGRAAGTPA